MCGRYTQKQKAAIIEKMYGIDKVVAEISASFNVCPGQDVAAIAGHAERRLGLLRWGLPSLKEGGRPLINFCNHTPMTRWHGIPCPKPSTRPGTTAPSLCNRWRGRGSRSGVVFLIEYGVLPAYVLDG